MKDPKTGRFVAGRLLGLSGKKRHPMVAIWFGMIGRCTNSNNSRYPWYGGRGIKICDRWMTFARFYEDMGPTYKPGFSIERRDNDGNYTPDNCEWILSANQANNRSNSIKITFRGVEKNLHEWGKEFGIPKGTIHYRFHRGWSIHKVFGLE